MSNLNFKPSVPALPPMEGGAQARTDSLLAAYQHDMFTVTTSGNNIVEVLNRSDTLDDYRPLVTFLVNPDGAAIVNTHPPKRMRSPVKHVPISPEEESYIYFVRGYGFAHQIAQSLAAEASGAR